MTNKNMAKVLHLRNMSRHNEKDELIDELSKPKLDFLTGLPDREALDSDLAKADAELSRGASTYAVIFADINNLKRVNDKAGHPEGDSLISRVATIIKYCVRDTDSVYKIGGDEMVILMRNVDPDNVDSMSHELIKKFKINLEHQIKDLPEDVYRGVGISAGFASPAENETAAEVLARADKNMYDDKRLNRIAYRTHE